ncbi:MULTISPECIES: hypothetical protein [Comamonas]|uniref:Uncharacterized protein n=1 Tax=Comamonas thiooxydans TaxID=363952 RepID=A0AA42TW94_9BURK|nr:MULTISPECIES: hypothetical protein [Comamonas]MBL5978941.1 hypothetical protein [Comamonas sp. NyZ500]MDH1253527.1 hypothetical protein [Comamonas thiooxydans]MDH1336934.1 hypothetical protein [Comamonas thiooxydans]MDH1742983.1 hypothetical protein [Comamonas thiooxydans]MDH1787590.1 hypothetical protein [Comamonas thiooxydans]
MQPLPTQAFWFTKLVEMPRQACLIGAGRIMTTIQKQEQLAPAFITVQL